MSRSWIVVAGVAAVFLAGAIGCSDADSNPDDAATSSDTSAQPHNESRLDIAGSPDCASADPLCVIRSENSELTVSGPVEGEQRVAPEAGHRLETISRDAGVAARLRDGSVLWLFGDTAARDDAGQIEYFIIGTASWAPADKPNETADHADPPTGEPVPFAIPTSDFPACPNPDQRAGMWPSAATVQAVGARDRVIVWLENVCVGEGPTLDDAGMSVAEWWYDPTAPPLDGAIRATMLNQQLFTERSFGSAVTPDGAAESDDAPGRLFTYRCNSAFRGSPDDYGPCFVAQTSIDEATEPSSYREWDGTAFAADPGSGVPLVMPEGPFTSPHPPGGLTVSWDSALDAYIMAYSPWPGPSGFMDLRISKQPQGPWSPPVTLHLPGCDDRLGEREFGCYAASIQPRFSSPGRLGIGYFDAMISGPPVRGSYMIASVPIDT